VRDGNKLAASVARGLIDIGVRCVVVAGWAVDDKLAQQFGEVFYQALLQDRRPFGNAVFEARQALWAARPDNVTWGAFQAYGDPLWLAEPDADGPVGASRGSSTFVSLDEMLDELARVRLEVARCADGHFERDRQTRIQGIEDARDKRCPPAWLRLPALQSAIGAAWRDLGCFEQAHQALMGAIQSVDLQGRVPIRDIEQLAVVEIELGAVRAAEDIEKLRAAQQAGKARTPRAAAAQGLPLIAHGIERLMSLDKLVSDVGPFSTEFPAEAAAGINSDRFAWLGLAHKRKAVVFAQHLLRLDANAAQRAKWLASMQEAARAALEAYARAEGTPGADGFRPYDALHGLALRMVFDGWDAPDEKSAAVALARQCGMAASRLDAIGGDPWDVVLNPEAVLIERLRDGSLATEGEAGAAALADVLAAYRAALENLGPRARHVERTVAHLDMRSTLFDALFLMGSGDAYLRMADALLAVIGQLRPGREARGDRPAGAIAA
jgi:hypothetical protein